MAGPAEKDRHLYEIIDAPQAMGVMFRTSVDQGSYIPSHWHRAVELIYLLEGELEVSAEDRTFFMKAGDCTLINANVMHSTKCTRPNTAILLQIPVDFMEIYIPDIQQLYFVLDGDSKNPVRQTKLEMLYSTLTQMQIVNDIRPEGFILRFNSLLFELLFQLLHNFSIKLTRAETGVRKKERDRLDQVLDHISRNYDRPISLEEIAGVACLQTGYFCRFFKKHMGITFLEYQNELRLSHIYRDLITTDEAVGAILERHGFTNYKLFRKRFGERFGTTPLGVRAGHEKNKDIP